MKIVIAIDSFKGSCSAINAAYSIERGIKSVLENVEVVKIPVADGGEGTVSAMLMGTKGIEYQREVTGPLGSKVIAKFAILDDGTAIIEMAAASGLTLIEVKKRNPLYTTTYGTGELILEAIKLGSKKIILGIGGSATNDGGVGAAMALGIVFNDINGNSVGYGGKELQKISNIDISGLNPLLKGIDIDIACDVSNPLYGETGAAYIYAAQKGANDKEVKELDDGLINYSKIIKSHFNFDGSQLPGAGAAGGLAIPLIAFCGAKIHSGIELILNALNVDDQFQNADLVITGEGRIDFQTIYGKVPIGVAAHAKKKNIPVIAIVGSIGNGYKNIYDYGIDSVFNIQNSPMSLEESMDNTELLLEDCAQRVMRMYLLSNK